MGVAIYRKVDSGFVRVRNTRYYDTDFKRIRGVHTLSFTEPADGLMAKYEFENNTNDSVGTYDLTAPEYTKALLHFEGSDGSTTFSDETGKIWIAHGNAQLDTAQQKFGSASGYFDGMGDFLTTPDSEDWSLGTSFTIEAWIRFSSYSATARYCIVGSYDGSKFLYMEILNGKLSVAACVTSDIVNNVSGILSWSNNTWYHVAWSICNGYSYIFRNGSRITINIFDAYHRTYNGSPMPNINSTLNIASFESTGSRYFKGWIDEVRISKGTARWVYNFTLPSEAYTYGTFYQAGIFGYAKKYVEGSDTSYITNPELTEIFRYRHAYSVSMWINLPAGAEILKQSNMELGLSNPSLIASSDALCFRRRNETGYTDVTGTGITYDIWHHICITYDGTTMCLYKDKTKWTGTNTSSNDAYGTLWFKIMGSTYPESKGLIDNVRIYNRALTDAEVETLYNETASGKRVML